MPTPSRMRPVHAVRRDADTAGASPSGRAGRAALPLAAALLLLVAGPAAAQFSTSPAVLELTNGALPVAAVVQVSNGSEQPLQLRFYAGDFDQLETGDHTFAELGEHPRSCGERLRIFPEGATLAPREIFDLRITLEAGAGTCWSMVFVENVLPATGAVRVAQRIGVKVYGIDPGEASEAEIEEVAVQEAEDGPEAVLTVRNLGGTPLRLEGSIEVRALSGEMLRTLPVDGFSALPGYRRRLRVPLGAGLPAGRYLAVPMLDFGAEYLIGGQTLFLVP